MIMKEITIRNYDYYGISKNIAIFRGDNIEVEDGYHSMNELYQHRMALNVALFRMLDCCSMGTWEVMKSKSHFDGTMFEGYFIVMAINLDRKQISYHYKLEHWDKFRIPEVEKAPEFDGHSSNDVIERLMRL